MERNLEKIHLPSILSSTFPRIESIRRSHVKNFLSNIELKGKNNSDPPISSPCNTKTFRELPQRLWAYIPMLPTQLLIAIILLGPNTLPWNALSKKARVKLKMSLSAGRVFELGGRDVGFFTLKMRLRSKPRSCFIRKSKSFSHRSYTLESWEG